ncbi:hypothetical protein [Microvirga tunisiensis]|uniref:DUF1311 domain-containing protein n=1 Tax=Microvirga tunisiensis TaxID=2108360 RepID=A0A5N7MB92_9HYPH|nr:hypothetical protein [Microvirga tunisiensis]MPR08173.1 hypothetical protein [Microvirga tunisiensis]MPR24115.1 hypothetical protein [Microvirga tunisiensis]
MKSLINVAVALLILPTATWSQTTPTSPGGATPGSAGVSASGVKSQAPRGAATNVAPTASTPTNNQPTVAVREDIEPILRRLGVASIDARPVLSGGMLCDRDLAWNTKGYASNRECQADSQKYRERALLPEIEKAKARAEKVAAELRAKKDIETLDLAGFVMKEEDITEFAGPIQPFSFISNHPVRMRYSQMHDNVVGPIMAPFVKQVKQRISQEYDHAPLSDDGLGAPSALCEPFQVKACMSGFVECKKRPLDNLTMSVRKELADHCSFKQRDIPTRRCVAAAPVSDPDGVFKGQRFAVVGSNDKLVNVDFPTLVCSAAKEGVQVRLRSKGLFFKSQQLEFGTIGDDDVAATAKLAEQKQDDGSEVHVIQSIDEVKGFSDPSQLIGCLMTSANGTVESSVLDIVIGTVAYTLGAEDFGSDRIGSAFGTAVSVDKCRQNIAKLLN